MISESIESLKKTVPPVRFGVDPQTFAAFAGGDASHLDEPAARHRRQRREDHQSQAAAHQRRRRRRLQVFFFVQLLISRFQNRHNTDACRSSLAFWEQRHRRPDLGLAPVDGRGEPTRLFGKSCSQRQPMVLRPFSFLFFSKFPRSTPSDTDPTVGPLGFLQPSFTGFYLVLPGVYLVT